MNKEKKLDYTSPQMEVVELVVEQAILQASGGDIDDMGYGGNNW